MGRPGLRLDPADAFVSLSAAFERAAQARPEACFRSFHVFAGRIARLRVVGRRLAERLGPPFAHLRLDAPSAAPQLTIDLFDEAETGVACDVVFSETGQATPDGRFVAHVREQTTTVLDRGEQRLVGRVGDTGCLSLHELGRPLFAPLMLWHQDRNVQPVHAGLVSSNGDGVLFGGPGGSGKSTVSIRCLEAGFAFMADDYIGLEDSGAGRFIGHSVFCSVHLEAKDLSRFPALVPRALPPRHPGEDKPLVILSEVFDRRLARSATIRAVALPRVTGVRTPTVRRASKVEALLRLAPSSLLLLPYARQGLAALARLVEAVPTYWLELGSDQDAIPDRVLDLLGAEAC